MSICFDKENKLFHLKSNGFSYVMQILDVGYLAHLYWGKPILNFRSCHTARHDNFVNLDVIAQEYSVFGTGDFRTPTVLAQRYDGSTASELKYVSHRIVKGKPSLSGLPSSYVEAEDAVSWHKVFRP